MRNIIYNILIASVILSLNCAPVMAAAMPEPVPATQTDKQKAAAAKKKEAEKKKKAAEKAKAAKAKEKEKAAKAKEAEKRKAEAAKANEKKREEAAKTAAKAQAQRDKEAAERAKIAQQREAEKVKKEAAEKAKEEKALRDYEKYQESLENPKTEVISYFNLGFRAGYAAMMDKLTKTENGSLWGAGTLNSSNPLQQLKGGPGAGLDLTYNLEYGHFRFETGFDFRFLNSTSAYGFSAVREDKTYPGTHYYYLFDNLKETRNLFQVGVPVMFGAQFGRYYFLLGAKVHYSVMGLYSHSGKYDIVVQDPSMLEPYGRGIHSLNGKTDKPIKFGQPDVNLAAEIGIDLDEWMQAQPRTDKEAKKKQQQVKAGERLPFGREHVHYRLGLFAEYGVLNTNKTAAAKPLEFEGQELVQKSNTLLAMNGNTKLNNLFVGAKFTIQFEVPGKKARPVPPPPAYAIYSVVDAETREPIKVAFIETHATESGKVALREKQIGPKGIRQKHALGKFTVATTAEGYLPDTSHFMIEKVGSTEYVTIALKPRPVPPVLKIDTVVPPKTGDIFIVRNLHFATNKTRILASSEEALHDLYSYLARNPNVRIKIIGHTDSVGRDAANQKLSDGRANEVRKDLIERGIAPERIEAEGRGESQPIDTNDTEEGRQNNRRVEIEIL